MHPPGPQASGPTHIRRDVQRLPHAILEHSKICLEEELFSQGLALQSRCLESGLEFDINAPARVPPPSHFAFASTLTVHPFFTNRTRKKDRQAASLLALKHLRQAIKTIDAQDGGLKDAVRFQPDQARDERSKRARARRSDPNNNSSDDDETDKTGLIRSDYSQDKSLWTHAEDFWAIVGWAFNCSVLHKHRWERWKAWLEQMLDLLHDDLEKYTKMKQDGVNVDFGETLLAQYISTVGEGRNNRRRIMRAITADGSKKMVAEFGAIWKNEWKPPPKKKKEEYSSKRRKLDIDNDEYGDYADPDSEDEDSESRRHKSESLNASPRGRRSKDGVKEQPVSDDEIQYEELETDGLPSSLDGVEAFGDMDSIHLRQRLLGILAKFSDFAPDTFMDIEELFALFTEFLRPLPLPVFQQFVLPLKPFLGPNEHASLLEVLLRPLLGTNHSGIRIEKNEFETLFAPHAAVTTSAADNAKASLLVESLMRILWRTDYLEGDAASLRASIDKGIKAREDKVAYDGRKKAGKSQMLHEQDRTVLQCSAERLLVLLDVMAS